MVALVLVSHSRALALALKETLERLYADNAPPIAVAAGAGDDGAELGTDATAIMAAVEEVGAAADGVLVLLDLGSAVLSAEMALELLDESPRGKVALCAAPLVEGAIAAAALCGIGAGLAEVRAEAENALRQKVEHLGTDAPLPPPAAPSVGVDGEAPTGPRADVVLLVENSHGLHARPAMKIVQTVGPFASTVQIKNLRTDAPAVSARSLVSINCLDVRQGDSIRVTAQGVDSAEAVQALQALHAQRFGDPPEDEIGADDAPPQPAAPTDPSASPAASNDAFPHGQPLSEGTAWGRLFFVPREMATLPPATAVGSPSAELARLHAALATVRRQLEENAAQLEARLGQGNAAILEAHWMLANDPALVERAATFIREDRLPAAHAWQQASRLTAESYRRLEQPILRERAADVEDLGLQVLQALGIEASLRLELPDEPCILAAPTLLPSEVAALDRQKVRGVLAEALGPTSHAAILLRAAGIVAVDGVDQARLHGMAGAGEHVAALDGGTGEVWLDPDPATLRALESRYAPPVADQVFSPLHTRDGRRIELAANVTSAADAAAAARAGAEAIGLLRTEFLFFDRTEAPTEDEQTEALRQVAAALPPEAPVTVRTFDIGGDKPVVYLPVPPEANPFLGVRGLRLALWRRDVFLTHLRAILRAAHGRRFRVMFPMVTEVTEVRQGRALLDEAHRQLAHAGVAHAWPVEVGMMIEVPAAALNVRSFVPEVDFFSLGTNDLTQYTLAAERGHPRLMDFSDALHPAVLRLVAHVAAVAEKHGKWVGVCGEAAADTTAGGVFVGLGVHELSVGVNALPRVRRLIHGSDYHENRTKGRRCLRAGSVGEVRRLWMD